MKLSSVWMKETAKDEEQNLVHFDKLVWLKMKPISFDDVFYVMENGTICDCNYDNKFMLELVNIILFFPLETTTITR